MADVYRSDVIPASATRVWDVIRDFNALPIWTPFVADSRIEAGMASDRVGCVRNFKLTDGGEIREKLIMLDDEGMACTYAILSSPMAVSDYRATLSLSPISTTNHCFAQWKAQFTCPSAEESALVSLIGDAVFATGLAHLRKRFGGAN